MMSPVISYQLPVIQVQTISGLRVTPRTMHFEANQLICKVAHMLRKDS